MGPEGSGASVALEIDQGDDRSGTWAPRSRDAVAELPALLDALPASLGRVRRISLSLDWWQGAHPSRIRVHDKVVKLGWFHSIDRDLVTLAGADATRLRLTLHGTPAEAPS